MSELLHLDDGDDDMSSDDEDYVPDAGEAVSEEEDSGEDEGTEQPINKKINSKQLPGTARKRTGGIRLEGESEKDTCEDAQEAEQLSEKIEAEKVLKKEATEKKKADNLWASFLGDVGTKPKPKTTASNSSLSSLTFKAKPVSTSMSSSLKSSEVSKDKKEKVTITKVFDFAGEAVEITKKVDADSKEAKELSASSSSTENAGETVKSPIVPGIKRPAGGLGSVLGKISKKPKISTLNKSKLDWDSFKEKEGISEELQTHNRGKEGYLERKAFLERTDLRQFEIEKNLRLNKR
ncbi:craniofacial development protein 1-like [Tubulanus polymorphus]|uniref:craniofacial development protein 1-like n=1 Tax=Tubulanus polymorphus TaxID=672921 RepID=UPI003DA5E4D1